MGSMTAKSVQQKMWSKDDFFITTDPGVVNLDELNEMFDSKGMYWAKKLPERVLEEMVKNSLNFSLFHSSQKKDLLSTEPPKFIGYARCITDYVTFIYLTDVYVPPDYQGKGLGKWMVACIQELFDEMPHLRRSMLITGDWNQSVPFYEKTMKMHNIGTRLESDDVHEQGLAVMTRLGRGSNATV